MLAAWIVLIAPALAPRMVSADFYVRLVEQNFSTTLGGVGDIKEFDSGYVSQSSLSHSQNTSYSTSAGMFGSMSASTTTSASLNLGHLGGSAFATANNQGLLAGSEVFDQLEKKDVVTAIGPVQADGFVHLPYQFTINDTITSAGGHGSSDFASARFIIGVSGAVSFSQDITDSIASPYTGQRTFSGDFVLLPGQQFVVNLTLEIHPFDNSTGGPTSYTVDATQSLDFHLNGSYRTDSGVSYASTVASSVPEPNTLALAVLGLPGIVAVIRRRRRPLSL